MTAVPAHERTGYYGVKGVNGQNIGNNNMATMNTMIVRGTPTFK